MQRWNWVLSADVGGRWITTQGYAEVVLGEESLRATLRFHAESDGVYHWVDATLNDDNVEALVRSPNPEVELFRLSGAIFKGAPSDGVHPMMVLLTDGTTVLSLAYGPRSHEGNI